MSITETIACGKGRQMLSKPQPAPTRGKPGRRRKYTLEFLLEVPDLMVKDGLSLEQIAARVHGKASTIIDLCYQHKIALPSRRKHRIYAKLNFSTLRRFQIEAAARDLNYNQLAERLLETIAKDNMFKAVLDD